MFFIDSQKLLRKPLSPPLIATGFGADIDDVWTSNVGHDVSLVFLDVVIGVDIEAVPTVGITNDEAFDDADGRVD